MDHENYNHVTGLVQNNTLFMNYYNALKSTATSIYLLDQKSYKATVYYPRSFIELLTVS